MQYTSPTDLATIKQEIKNGVEKEKKVEKVVFKSRGDTSKPNTPIKRKDLPPVIVEEK